MANETPMVKRIIKILSVLLVVSLVALAGVTIVGYLAPVPSTSVVVPDNVITTDETRTANFGGLVLRASAMELNDQNNYGAQDTKLSLHKFRTSDNVAFNAGNMFPGDQITQYFNVRVSHKDNVVVRFRAEVDSRFNGLKDVLKCRVALATGELLYDGLMKDMPASLDVALKTSRRTDTDVTYVITAYLDTSVGNAYMNKSLLADFRWWVEGKERPALIGSTPKTGDDFPLAVWGFVGASSLILLFLLLVKRRKEDEADERQ